MLQLLLRYLLTRPLTGQTPPVSGIGALASTLRDQQSGLGAVQAASFQFYLDANGDAVVIMGQDISHAPIHQYSANPSTESTSLTGPGIASKHTGSWVRVA